MLFSTLYSILLLTSTSFTPTNFHCVHWVLVTFRTDLWSRCWLQISSDSIYFTSLYDTLTVYHTDAKSRSPTGSGNEAHLAPDTFGLYHCSVSCFLIGFGGSAHALGSSETYCRKSQSQSECTGPVRVGGRILLRHHRHHYAPSLQQIPDVFITRSGIYHTDFGSHCRNHNCQTSISLPNLFTLTGSFFASLYSVISALLQRPSGKSSSRRHSRSERLIRLMFPLRFPRAFPVAICIAAKVQTAISVRGCTGPVRVGGRIHLLLRHHRHH